MDATGISVTKTNHALAATHAIKTISARGTDIARLMLIVPLSSHAKILMVDWAWYVGIVQFQQHAHGLQIAQSLAALACQSQIMIKAITASIQMRNLLIQL